MTSIDRPATDLAPKTRTRRPRRDGAKMNVLAVDDDQNILALLQTALNTLGEFDVSIAASGADALRQIERTEKPFDCFLLDIQMPNMNGIDLCQAIRKQRAYHNAPIIMLTAMSERKYIDESFVAGATDYVTKPFDFFELRSRLSAAQRLVREHARASDSVAVARKLKEELDANLMIALDDPIGMPNIERMLGFSEFENYVVRLGQGRRFNTFVSAIRIDGIDQHHQSLSSSDFREGLQDVGRALSKVTRKTGNILSYRGKGVFLCVSHGRSAVPSDDLLAQLNKLIATIMASRQASFRFEVSASDPVSLRLTSRSGALYALSRAAEAPSHDAEILENEDAEGAGRKKLRGRRMQGESGQNDRRAYEAILKDLLTEEPALNRY
ncbi:MAG: response regulator [Marinibacterium sp.]